jgi:hypothetical protein
MRATFAPREGGRLPSPLHFRVHTLGASAPRRYVVTLLNLAQGEGAQVLLGCTIGQNGEAFRIVTPDGAIVDQAIRWMLDEARRMPQARPGGRR